MSITSKIDSIVTIPESHRGTILPAPRSVKIELTGRCNYKCLRGDVLVDTIHGAMPIKELAENYDTVPVYTYKDGEVFLSDARNIMKLGENEKLVRVQFDDGTHMDCTPDHKFLQFKPAGSGPGTKEFAVEAQHLKPKARIRAYRENKVGGGYINICVGRNFRRGQQRVVMDYVLGRNLKWGEYIHHKDHNPTNNNPDNLLYASSAKDHYKEHPEIAERMRTDNPAFNMTPEWREKLRKAVTGKTRSLEQRMRYRESKLGAKNPNYKGGAPTNRSRIAEINHKVVSVTHLEETADVYCLEVPETGWFFANKVLVKNCSFCARSEKLRDQKEMDWDLFTRLLLEMREAGVEEIGLFYLGESFMSKHLEKAIGFAKNVAGFPYVFLTTNGSLATPDRMEQCFINGLDSLKFSLNYSDESQFEDIARVKKTQFHKMMKNIRAAKGVRDKVEKDTGHRCGLYGSYILYDGKQGVRMEEMAKDMEQYLDELYGLPLYGQAGPQDSPIEGENLLVTGGNTGRAANPVPALPCWAVATEGHITWSGKMSACCWDHTSKLEMGDLTKNTFLECWNSEKFQALRAAHLSGDVHGTPCEACIYPEEQKGE